MIAEFNLGNIVTSFSEGYTFKKIGIVSDPRGVSDYAWKNHATNNDRIPVMFPGFSLPHWFSCYDIRHATERERRTYFKNILRNGK